MVHCFNCGQCLNTIMEIFRHIRRKFINKNKTTNLTNCEFDKKEVIKLHKIYKALHINECCSNRVCGFMALHEHAVPPNNIYHSQIKK